MGAPEKTTHSEVIKGDRGNYNWGASFDLTGGHLGITLFEGDKAKDRVLLSPSQVRELITFVKSHSR